MSLIYLTLPLALLLFFLLFAASILTIQSTALLRVGKFRFMQSLEGKRSSLFFFFYFLKKVFAKNLWENILFLISFTKHILHLIYALTAFLTFFVLPLWKDPYAHFQWVSAIFSMIVIIAVALFFDFFVRFFASVRPRLAIKASAIFASVILSMFFPLTLLFVKLKNLIFTRIETEDTSKRRPLPPNEEIIAMIHDSGMGRFLDRNEEKIIASFITFREKVAREIMIPRIDLFALAADISIKKAAELFVEEDYSRVPVYKDNLDQIIGILMYKDILKIYARGDKDLLDNSIESLVKPVLYTPENKKIPLLFQEFRKKQTHLAVVVNEYGGTEGIVTIEDILEELVGEEIEDEYDIDEDRQFWKLPSGSWIIDAKMSIVDIENKLHIRIPHSPEYETIGGYVFHVAGTIPSKGWSLHHDDFVIEVLISNERCIEKIRITPVKKKFPT